MVNTFALHSWTLGQPSLADLIGVAKRTGYGAIEINWQNLGGTGQAGAPLGETRARLCDAGIEVAVVGVEPNWLFGDPGEADGLRDRISRMAQLAAQLDCRTLMSALGQTRGPVAAAERSIRIAADACQSLDVRLAIEFNFGHPVLSSLDAVRDLVKSAGSPACGLVLDSYHLHRAGRAGRGFGEIEPALIMHVQVSDVPDTPEPLGTVPLDRLAPGAGKVDWTGFFQLLQEKDYSGPISFEAPNPLHWGADPDAVARGGLQAIHRMMERANQLRPRNPSSG